MDSAFMLGIELVKRAAKHDWLDRGPGGSHPYILTKAGYRPVLVRDKLQNPNEVRGLLKELGISRSGCPPKVR